ncbi:MAG: hypothetical protein HQK65_19800, partial [Desulfamplus sp.]|nr:hypothetical protein [Desulfamplus sp.]
IKVLLRPVEIQAYETPLDACIAHYLKLHQEIDAVGVFMPTYPFRDLAKIRDIDNHLRSKYVWDVKGISDQKYSTSDFYYPVTGGFKKLFDHRPMQYSIFTANYTYFHRHTFGGLRSKYCLTSDERMLYVHSSREECIDIDTQEDFDIAQKIANGGKLVPAKGREHVFGDWIIYTPDGVDIDKFINYVGFEKLEDIRYPLVVIKKIQHSFARFLHFRLFIGRSIFMNLDAYKHVYPTEASAAHVLQTFPPEFRAVPAYRLLRTDNSKKFSSSESDYPDNHGVHFGGIFNDVNSSNFVTLDNGHTLGPDTLSPERVIDWNDLSKQDFFVDSVEIVYE